MSGHFNYPLEETNGNARPPPKRQGSGESGQSGYREMKSVRRTPSDLYNVMSDSEGTKQRRASLKASNASAGRKRSRNTLRDKDREKTQERVDDSAWIHRDKLAEIEIQEMEAAGIDVRAARRSMSAGPGASARSSRSQSRTRRPMSKDRQSEKGVEEPYSGTYEDYYETFEPKRISTIPAADEDEQDFDPNVDTELRTPQEVAEERESISNVIRPSTSRIPLSKVSPVPVPQNVVGRDSPLPRSRNGSGAWSGNWDEMQYARRARSNSMGSQVMLDDEGVRTPSRPGSSHLRSSDENSPGKARVPNKSTPTSGARKVSLANGIRPGSSSGSKPRTSSTKDRPTSRSGHKSRPSTSHQHAPEGEAPWIASMYKPDPRLPPDQQMLPTHAKRMMQEQWEKEGRAGTAYDRDLRPMNDERFPAQPSPQKPRSPAPPANLEQPQRLESPPTLSPSPSPGYLHQLDTTTSPNSTDMNAWPLTPMSDTKSDNGSVRPGTSGGYRITPTITTPPTIERSPTRQRDPVPSPHNPTPRVPEFDEKDEAQPKKGGCGCCIIM